MKNICLNSVVNNNIENKQIIKSLILDKQNQNVKKNSFRDKQEISNFDSEKTNEEKINEKKTNEEKSNEKKTNEEKSNILKFISGINLLEKKNGTKVETMKFLDRKIKKDEIDNVYLTYPKFLVLNNVKDLIDKKMNKKFNNYKIGAFLGQGRYGKVFIAKDNLTNMLYAIKKISKKLLKNKKLIINEILIQKSLNHQNILKLHDFFSDENYIYLILELASEGEIFEIQKQKNGRKFTEMKAKQIMKQILYGVRYMHEKGFIHGDLKPENIFISIVT